MFPSVEAARQHLRSRRVFSTMDPAVFDIYINECLVPCEDGSKGSVKLLYDKHLEAEIYHRVPYDIPYLSKHILNQYGMTAGGKYYYTKHNNSILHSTDYNWVRNHFPTLQCIEYKESHFWPLENIDDFSSVIAHDIVDILVSDAA